MQNLSDWYFALIFFSAVLGFIVSGILIFVNDTDNFSSRLLAGFLICISLLALNYALMVTTFFLRFPHLWRIVGWASFSFAPFCYLYVRSVLEQSYRFRRWDFLLFLPAVLYMVNLIPFFIRPTPEKVVFLKKVVEDPRLVAANPEGMLPPAWGIWARVLLGTIVTIAQLRLLIIWREKITGGANPVPQNISTFRWLTLLTLINLVFWVLIILEFSFHFLKAIDLNQLVIFTISGNIVLVSIALLIRPNILYGMTGWMQVAAPVSTFNETALQTPTVELKRPTLSIAQGQAIKEALDNHFSTNHPYLKNGYTIADLSRELQTPSHQLSALINQEYGKNFNELVNQSRVKYLEGLVRTSLDHQQYTLEALGKMAGFNSRTSFIAAVKKFTGMTPSEFIGRVRQRNI